MCSVRIAIGDPCYGRNDSGMDFRLLGPLEVVERDRPLALGGVKQRSLLAILLLQSNELVSTDRLIDQLWGATPPATCAKSIQVYVSRLRKQIGTSRLATHAPGYTLHVEPSELDLARFEQLADEALRTDPQRAARKLRDALALWRGSPLADLAYEPFAQPEIARLEELRIAVLEQRIDADLAVGRHAEAVRASDHFPVVADLLTATDVQPNPEVPGHAVQEQGAAAEVRPAAGRGKDLGRDL